MKHLWYVLPHGRPRSRFLHIDRVCSKLFPQHGKPLHCAIGHGVKQRCELSQLYPGNHGTVASHKLPNGVVVCSPRQRRQQSTELRKQQKEAGGMAVPSRWWC